MPFVHSLVKSPSNKEEGWCAPVELGEGSPHYVSFVVPVDEKGHFFDAYLCEAVTTRKKQKTIAAYELSSRGNKTFKLTIGGKEFWFIVKPGSNSARRLPYIGRLKHSDFQYVFVEIEPEKPESLDDFCDEDHTFVMGCDPFTHYLGIKHS